MFNTKSDLEQNGFNAECTNVSSKSSISVFLFLFEYDLFGKYLEREGGFNKDDVVSR